MGKHANKLDLINNFSCENNAITFEGYDRENEEIAAALSGDNSFLIFWDGLQLLYEGLGKEAFRIQVEIGKRMVFNNPEKVLPRAQLPRKWSKNPEIGYFIYASRHRTHREVMEAISNMENPLLLDLLAKSQYDYVGRAVAEHPLTLASTQKRLSLSKDEGVLIDLANNPRTLPEILGILSEDEN